jgi:hypothetical protein
VNGVVIVDRRVDYFHGLAFEAIGSVETIPAGKGCSLSVTFIPDDLQASNDKRHLAIEETIGMRFHRGQACASMYQRF